MNTRCIRDVSSSVGPRSRALLLIGLGAGATLGACDDRHATPEGEGGRVAIEVAPLAVTDIKNACYRVTVSNARDEVVWTRGAICADRFGDEAGAISYVAPCDATLVGGQAQLNSVTLELEDLWDAGGIVARDSYKNPCGHEENGNQDGFGPCVRRVACLENADARVTYNLTILRDARQGFFDVAVDFEDLFCSAKLDCRHAEDPIELLFTPEGTRGQTAVLALSCAAGRDEEVVLHMGPMTLSCEDGTDLVLDPAAAPGNAWTAEAPDPDPEDAVWQVATYRGESTSECPGGTCRSLSWSVAVGFDPARPGCTLSASATAAWAERMKDWTTPAGATWPWIAFEVPLTWPRDGGLLCHQNPLDAPGSGVRTGYTPVDEARRFCHAFDGATVTSSGAAECAVGHQARRGVGPVTLTAAKAVIAAGTWTTLVPTFSLGTGTLSEVSGATLGAVTSGIAVPVAPEVTTTYLLTVTTAAGDTRTAEATVSVTERMPEIVALPPPVKRVGMFYHAWHVKAANALMSLPNPADRLTIEDVIRDPRKGFGDILAKHNLLAAASRFHYHKRPALGFYCLYRKRPGEPQIEPDCPGISGVAATHADQLWSAGIDFVHVDLTNFRWQSQQADLLALRPLEVLFEEWRALRAAGQPTPDIAAWVPAVDSEPGLLPLYERVLEVYQAFPDLVMRHAPTGQPVLFVVDRPNEPAMGPTQDAMAAIADAGVVAVRMWGNLTAAAIADGRAGWQQPCLSPGTDQRTTLVRPDQACGQRMQPASPIGSVLSVSAFFPVNHPSMPFAAAGKLDGLTLKKQFETAFAEQPDYLLLNAWNEHIAQSQPSPGEPHPYAAAGALGRSMGKTDPPPGDAGADWIWDGLYGEALSRDLEPTVEDGGAGYALLQSCLRVYRTGQACTKQTRGEICCQLGSGHELVRSLRGVNDGGTMTTEHVPTTDDGEYQQLIQSGAFAPVCNYPQAYAPPGLCGSGTSGDGPFLLFAGPAPGRAALYRCRGVGDTFMSQSPLCEGKIPAELLGDPALRQSSQSPGELLGYVSLTQTSNSPRSLLRCRNGTHHFHHLAGPCPSGTVGEGLLGYVK